MDKITSPQFWPIIATTRYEAMLVAIYLCLCLAILTYAVMAFVNDRHASPTHRPFPEFRYALLFAMCLLYLEIALWLWAGVDAVRSMTAALILPILMWPLARALPSKGSHAHLLAYRIALVLAFVAGHMTFVAASDHNPQYEYCEVLGDDKERGLDENWTTQSVPCRLTPSLFALTAFNFAGTFALIEVPAATMAFLYQLGSSGVSLRRRLRGQ